MTGLHDKNASRGIRGHAPPGAFWILTLQSPLVFDRFP